MLAVLAERSPLSQTRVAEILGLDRTTILKLGASLEQLGLVVRERDVGTTARVRGRADPRRRRRCAQQAFRLLLACERRFLSDALTARAQPAARPPDPVARDMSTSRLEAFSDGVIAVAITLLVLDIARARRPAPLARPQPPQQWPHYAAYVVSFVTIGIIWINHHVMVGGCARRTARSSGLNLLLLLTIGVLPFATSLMAEYVNKSTGSTSPRRSTAARSC